MECHIDSVTYFLGLLGAGSVLCVMNYYAGKLLNDDLSTKIEQLRKDILNDEEHTD